MTRKIAFVTTSRSDYNTMFPLMREATKDPEISQQIICAGMHLLEKFGQTWKELEKDGLTIDAFVDFLSGTDDELKLAIDMGNGVGEFAKVFKKLEPDIICVSGDRFENLALFTAATILSIPIAHHCGGDITEGAIDNQIRHAMTKLSHLHFTMMQEHADRVVQMGEEPWRVQVTGDAALDLFSEIKLLDKAELANNFGTNWPNGFVLCVYHPETIGEENFLLQFQNIVSVLSKQKQSSVVIYPNIDPGYTEIVSEIEKFENIRPDTLVLKNVRKNVYYSLLKHCDFMIGNSSSGIWEAPSFNCAYINVGQRQAGRKKGSNVLNVSGFDLYEIVKAIQLATAKDFRDKVAHCGNLYGDGYAAERIIAQLKSVDLGLSLKKKLFHDLS